MNKLQGFFQLQSLGIPVVPWRLFTYEEPLDAGLLWTIRVAVDHGNDMNLPRTVGANAETTRKIGRKFLDRYQKTGIVIYYPYFIALKSGNLELGDNITVIEAVKDDLWNLTTDGGRDITVIIDRRTQEMFFHGKNDFLESNEITQLMECASRARRKLKGYINMYSSVLLEWSYAVKTDINHEPIGDPYLVFYECRTIKARG